MPAQQNTPLVSPAKALQKVIAEQRSGRLQIQDINDPSIGWRVYFGAGQIHFAESTMGCGDRLRYILRKHSLGLEGLPTPADATSDYPLLCQYWQAHNLPLNNFRKLLAICTQEALIQFLAIAQSHIAFEATIGLDPLLLSVPFRQLILPVRDHIGQWAQIRADLTSPFQRIFIHDREQFLKFVWQEAEKWQQLQGISHDPAEATCLYDLAHQLGIDVLELAAGLQPLCRSGVLGVQPYQVITQEAQPVIACVDDSATIQQFVKLSLESSGYEVLSLQDPTEAIPHLVERQPLVILMDIEMPKIDGYELCRMVRQVDELKEVPVVMLTGRDGIIDRVRARMSGCTAYLTKPFNPQDLLAQVQKLATEPVVSV
ncbi:Transcriptional regulatory protein WalR [Acaryochloris thomasi RCC1774]|uniref:Transcriptional regulatory protein WalR n=1 Tax=Acaryochloris thomasi RCC1774 TaxID=1764569 RepID=A0A2W1JMQ4_9CYAN|nr:response regulator [Acaryochloris thomasi]PZD74603.1 Transcriptional regulatory protein WalR [Acaryochloris thomasi RCC1774]